MKIAIDIHKQEHQRIIAGALVLVVLFVLFGVFILVPMIKRTAMLTAREGVLRTQLQNAQVVASDKDKLYDEVKSIEENIEFLESRLPPGVDVAQVLEQLIRMGKETGVTFVSLEPLEVKRISVGEGTAGYAEIPVKLNLRTSYHAFGQFVTAIENSQRFMRVHKIRIQSVTQDMSRHDVSVEVNAYALEGGRNGG